MYQPTTSRLRRPAAGAVVAGLAAFAAGWLTAPPPALACSCLPPPPPAEALAAADAAFRGTVIAVASNDLGVSATLRVRTVWKGPLAPRLDVHTATNSAACGYPFRLGDDTIVYAHGEAAGTGTHWFTNSCDRTAAYAAAEAAALGTPRYDRPVDDPPVPNCPRCPIPSAAGALANADVAFLGRPLRVRDAGSDGGWERRVAFRVLGVWKGDPPAEVEVVAPYAAWACRGDHWLDDDAGTLVFAQRAGDGGLSVSICGRLARYDAQDAASLGPLRPGGVGRLYVPSAARLAP